MKDKLTGAEALATLPFRDIALPYDDAVVALTQNTMRCVKLNMQLAIDSINASAPQAPTIKDRFRQIRNNPERFVPPGGNSFAEDELSTIYALSGPRTFRQVVGGTVGMIPSSGGSRNPGVVFVGYMTDLLGIVNPEMATYDESLGELLNGLRDVGMDMFYLGAMVEDTEHLRGTKDVPIDFFGDREAAAKLKDHIQPLLTPEENVDFIKGYQITREEMLRDLGEN